MFCHLETTLVISLRKLPAEGMSSRLRERSKGRLISWGSSATVTDRLEMGQLVEQLEDEPDDVDVYFMGSGIMERNHRITLYLKMICNLSIVCTACNCCNWPVLQASTI